ncbi:MAG: VanZ family protein [Anaerolineae bacterium]
MRRFVGRWLPVLLWMGLIFVFSAQPSLPSVPGRWDVLLKKTMHALAYGVLAGLIVRALRGYWSDDGLIRLVSIGLALAYALSDEYHQTFVPGRDGNLIDVAADAVGMAGAMVLDRRWWEERRRGAGQASG